MCEREDTTTTSTTIIIFLYLTAAEPGMASDEGRRMYEMCDEILCN